MSKQSTPDLISKLTIPSATSCVLESWDEIRALLLKGEKGRLPGEIFENILFNIDQERREAANRLFELEASLAATFSQVVNVIPLEWVEEETNWWSATPSMMIVPCGYEVRVTDLGFVRIRRGNESWNNFGGSPEEAKAYWQDDLKKRVLSAIQPKITSTKKESN